MSARPILPMNDAGHLSSSCISPEPGLLDADDGVPASPRWQHHAVHPTPFATEQSEVEMGTDSPQLEPAGSTASMLDAACAGQSDPHRTEGSAEWGRAGMPDSTGSLDHAAAGAAAGSTFIYPCDELDCSDEEAARVRCPTMRFQKVPELPVKRRLKYYRISQCACLKMNVC